MNVMACERPAPEAAARQAAALSALVPVLDTDRLRLRAPRLADFPAYAGITCSPRGQWLGTDMTRDAAWYDFAAMTAGWLLRGHGLWAVETRANAALMGFVVLGFEPGDTEPELGYMFTGAGEGHGFAQEAAEAARAYAFDTLRLPGLVSYIFAENRRSVALAERLGARLDGTLACDGDAAPSLVYRHPGPGDVT